MLLVPCKPSCIPRDTICQEAISSVTSSNPRADVFTRADFDGDWDFSNIWENLPHYHIPAYVYYDVIESETHYFITYGFFYPRDYAKICFWEICHENDFEGMRITVSKGTDHGKAVLLETWAHGNVKGHTDPAFFTSDDGHARALITIERGGHGIHAWKDRKADKHSFLFTPGQSAEDTGSARSGSFRYALVPLRRPLRTKPRELGD